MPELACGLVLGAGGSKRLGRPKQLLPYRDGTLLGHVVATARACRFDQTIVAIGGAASDVRAGVDLGGVQVVVNDAYGEGCSSSIAAALAAVDPRCGTLVLMLGDQPGVTAETVAALLGGRGDAVAEVRVPGPIPLDVDTREDYEAVLAARLATVGPPAAA